MNSYSSFSRYCIPDFARITSEIIWIRFKFVTIWCELLSRTNEQVPSPDRHIFGLEIDQSPDLLTWHSSCYQATVSRWAPFYMTQTTGYIAVNFSHVFSRTGSFSLQVWRLQLRTKLPWYRCHWLWFAGLHLVGIPPPLWILVLDLTLCACTPRPLSKIHGRLWRRLCTEEGASLQVKRCEESNGKNWSSVANCKSRWIKETAGHQVGGNSCGVS